MRKKYGLVSLCLVFVLNMVSAQETSQFIYKHLNDLMAKEVLLSDDCKWQLLRSHRSSTSGVLHIYFMQTIEGIPLSGSESSLHLDRDYKTVKYNSAFVKNVRSGIKENKNPLLSGLDAVNKAIDEFAYPVTEPISVLESNNQGKKLVLSDAGYFEEQIRPKLQWIYTDDEQLALVWEFHLAEKGYEHYWRVVVDAANGRILSKHDDILYCTFSAAKEQSSLSLNYNFNPYPPSSAELSPVNCSNCYELFADPMESPYDGERVIVQDPAHPTASPLGWHDFNEVMNNTSGNNANVYTRWDNYRAPGGVNLNFTGFEFDENYTPTTKYRDAALTNVFYWINYLHDMTYISGFDEASGNFQDSNFGNEGEGGDRIDVIIQRGQRCNATVLINSEDGIQPTINLYSCGNKDGAVDNTVLMHEFGHAIIRRVGCGAFAGEEGLADYFAALFTLKPTDDGVQGKAIANYFFNLGIDGGGVRQYPYSTDFGINPDTYGDTRDYQFRHAYGAVWGVIIWDLTWYLIDTYGFDPDYRNFTGIKGQDSGNIMALAITIEALKLMPCPSGFVDFRNAIIEAASLIYGEEMNCELWPPFANRGLGQSAKQGNPYIVRDNEEAFDLPPETASFSVQGFETCHINAFFEDLGGAYPYGGVYSGPGVIDNGNGLTYSFDVIEAGPGVHEITYSIEDSACTIVSTDSIEITVFEDKEGPTYDCPGTVSMIVNDFTPPVVPNVISNINLADNCGENWLSISQKPSSGTEILDPLNPPVIQIVAVDKAGNETLCEVLIDLTVKEVNRFLTDINLYPNPSNGTINVEKTQGGDFISASVFSLSGELVKHYNLQQVENETILIMENLASGAYLIRFSMLQSDDIIKYILIE